MIPNAHERAVLAATLPVLLEAAERDPWQARRIPSGGAAIVRALARACSDRPNSGQVDDLHASAPETSDSGAMTRMLDRTEVGHVLGVGESTVRRLIADGELLAVRIRGQVRVHVDDLDDYLDRLRDAGRDREGTAA